MATTTVVVGGGDAVAATVLAAGLARPDRDVIRVATGSDIVASVPADADAVVVADAAPDAERWRELTTALRAGPGPSPVVVLLAPARDGDGTAAVVRAGTGARADAVLATPLSAADLGTLLDDLRAA